MNLTSKYLRYVLAGALVFFGTMTKFNPLDLANAETKAQSAELTGGKHFGAPFSNVPLVGITELLAKPFDFRRQKIRTYGLVQRQCPASGCWIFINDEKGSSIRVELSDYFPTLPQSVGSAAMVEGEIVAMGSGFQFVAEKVAFYDATEMKKLVKSSTPGTATDDRADGSAESKTESCH